MKLALLTGTAVAVLFAAPAMAGMGGTHTTTDTQHRTVQENRNTTHVNTQHTTHAVPDVTIERTITRVHPVHHVTEIEKVLHHQKVVNSNENVTHRHVAPTQVEHTHSTEHAGAAGHPREHVITHYRDIYQPDYSTHVHERTGSPAIMHEIHRHVTDITVQPVVHEHDITRVIDTPRYVHRTEHEHSEVAGAARTIVTHKREDVDP